MSSTPAPVTALRLEAARLLLTRKAAHEANRADAEARASYYSAIRVYREIRGPQPGDRVSVGEGLPKTWGRPLADVISRGEKTALVRLCGFDHAEKRVPVAGLDVGAMELLVAAHDDVEAELELDDADHAALDELVAGPIVGLPVVVIPCSSKKLDHRAPAAELYVGSYFRAALAAARALVDGDDSRIRILSGLHGFLPLDFPVNPYEQRIDQPGAISDEELEAEVAADPVLRDASKVTVLAGRAYAERAARALAAAEWPMALAYARGIGDHLRYFAQLSTPDNQETPVNTPDPDLEPLDPRPSSAELAAHREAKAAKEARLLGSDPELERGFTDDDLRLAGGDRAAALELAAERARAEEWLASRDELKANDPVRFVAERLGTIASLDSTRFEEEVVHRGDLGTLFGPHPSPRLEGWWLVCVRIHGRDLFVPCHREQIERAS